MLSWIDGKPLRMAHRLSAESVAASLRDSRSRCGTSLIQPRVAPLYGTFGICIGSIIYDFGDRRLNEIYPDKRLAQAAARAARTGMFPLGAHGAGRMAKTGHIFDCGAYSGQGGAFKQIGDLKIAAFTVANAAGVVTDRSGKVVACYRDKDSFADKGKLLLNPGHWQQVGMRK